MDAIRRESAGKEFSIAAGARVWRVNIDPVLMVTTGRGWSTVVWDSNLARSTAHAHVLYPDRTVWARRGLPYVQQRRWSWRTQQEGGTTAVSAWLDPGTIE
jgi:hypothetical protein